VIAGVVAIPGTAAVIRIQYAKRWSEGKFTVDKLNISREGQCGRRYADHSSLKRFLLFSFENSEHGVRKNDELAGLILWRFRFAQGPVHTLSRPLRFFSASYGWQSNFNRPQIAADPKRITAISPVFGGEKTTRDFLEYTLTRITLAGAVLLTLNAVIPEL